ncbi:helix-turn-helix domain-containing protein [Streptomyces niveus]|uniref:helix-turn-helix domain-containing protein n=1 Tax=Streptomyces niveus TaxID=193462 RepID=UPI00344FF408
MPGPKELDPSSSPRAMVGSELRHARESLKMTQPDLGAPLFVSGSFIGQLELGTRRMQMEYAIKFDEILGTDGFFVRNCAAAMKSKYPDHFADAAEAEAIATAIKEYAPQLIPGLLQTEAYARAVFHAYQPTATEDVIDQLVEARLERANLLSDPTTPLFWGILDEATLRRQVGDAAVMAGALRHVADLMRRRRIIVQVLPFTSGAHAAMGGGLKLMSFSDPPPLVYLHGAGSGQLLDDPASVAQYELAYDLLRANALPLRESLPLIAQLAEDYDHEAQQQ